MYEWLHAARAVAAMEQTRIRAQMRARNFFMEYNSLYKMCSSDLYKQAKTDRCQKMNSQDSMRTAGAVSPDVESI